MLRGSAESARPSKSEELVSLRLSPSASAVSSQADGDAYFPPSVPNARLRRTKTLPTAAVFLVVTAVVSLLLHCSRYFIEKGALSLVQRRLASGREGDGRDAANPSDPEACGESKEEGWIFEEEEDEEAEFPGVAGAQVTQAAVAWERGALVSGEEARKRKAHGGLAEWPHSSAKAVRLPGHSSVSDVTERTMHAQFQHQSSIRLPVAVPQSSQHLGSLAAQQQVPARAPAAYMPLYPFGASSSKSGQATMPVFAQQHHLGGFVPQQQQIPPLPQAGLVPLFPSTSPQESRLPVSPRPPSGSFAPQQQTSVRPVAGYPVPYPFIDLQETAVPGILPHHLISLAAQPQQQTSAEARVGQSRAQTLEAPSGPGIVDVPAPSSSDLVGEKIEGIQSLRFATTWASAGRQEPPAGSADSSQQEVSLVKRPDEPSSSSDSSVSLEQALLEFPESTLDQYLSEALQEGEDEQLAAWLLDPESLPPASPGSEISQREEEAEESKEAEALSATLVQLFQEAEEVGIQQQQPVEPSPSSHSEQSSFQGTTAQPSASSQQSFLPHPIYIPPTPQQHFYVGGLPGTSFSTSQPPEQLFLVPGTQVLSAAPYQGLSGVGAFQALLSKPSLIDPDFVSLRIHAEELVRHAREYMVDPIVGTMPSKLDVPMSKRFLVADVLWSVAEVLGSSVRRESWWTELMDKMLADPVNWPPADRRRTATGLHVNRLLAAFRRYRAGERPSAKEVVELKRKIFWGGKASYYFRQPAWDSWRSLDAQYVAALSSD
ncbi:hypothetical protein ACSSS7_005795 [Eimeria intestinalis]